MAEFDVAKTVQIVRDTLKEHNFRPRDGDGTDYQFGTDPGLRFKTGTMKGEVSITVWQHTRQVRVIRIFNEAQIEEALHEVDALVHDFFQKRRA